MKKLFYTFLITILISCQIEDDNAPLPEEGFIKYIGVLAEQEAKDLEPIWNADSSDIEGFVILGSQLLEGGTKDYYVARTDAAGNLINSTAFGYNRDLRQLDFDNDGEVDIFLAEDEPSRIVTIPSGYAVIGTSTFSIPQIDLIDLSVISYAFLDRELNRLQDTLFIRTNFRPNNRDESDFFGNDMLRLSDGSFLVLGAQESSTDLDFFAQRFSLQPRTLVWEETYGLKGGGLDDVFIRGFEKDNGNIALFGYSDDFGDNGEQGTNVTFIEVNTNGNIVGSNSIGIEDDLVFDFQDVPADVIQKPGGYLAVGTSTVDNNTFAFFMDIDENGLSSRKDTLSSEFTFAGDSLQTQALGVTASRSNDFVIVGQYPSFRTDANSRDGAASRGAEAMFMRINQLGEKVDGFENHYGLGDGNDSAVDAVVLPDGKIVVLATIDFGGSVKMISLIKLNDTGQLDQ